MNDLNIKNGKIFYEDRLIEACLSIEKGKIVTIGNQDTLPLADETIDATDQIILPGSIDVHTHILDLNYSYREDFVSGTQAAASGGITTILEMPLGIEEHSVLDVFDKQLETMNKKCFIDFGIIGAAGFTSIDSIAALAQRGAIAFKTFMINPSEEEAELKDLASKDDAGLIEIFSEVAKTDRVSCVHAENDAIIAHEIDRLSSLGRVDFDAHTESRPAISEDEACMRAILFAQYTGVKLHLVHMSSNYSFNYIRKSKKKIDVTCEVTPHHLFLTSEDGKKIGTWAKVDPPLRSKSHMNAAWMALNDGTIDIIASDHSPYSDEEKALGEDNNFFRVGSGTTGIETILPLMLDAINKGKTTLKRLVESTSSTPAKRFGLYPQKGTITLGSDADLMIVDMQEEYTLRNEDLFTLPKITVFNGRRLKGRVVKTLVRGKLIYDEGEILGREGYGKSISKASQLSEI
ncbi:MAG: dihydroorotase family protein [Promethearchaeota archaeon]